MSAKIRLGINLIAFNETKAIGTLVFMRRLFIEMSKMDLSRFHLLIYIQKGIDLQAFCVPNKCEHEIIYVPHFKSTLVRILFEQTLFYGYLQKMDVFYTPSSISLPWFTRCKKVFTVHDMVPFIFPKKYSWFRRKYIQLTTRLCLHIGDKIITVSENSKKDILSFTGICSDKIVVIYNFITDGETITTKGISDIKTTDGTHLDLHQTYFLTVSTLHPAKNIEGLLEAFSLFSQGNPDYWLYIVGNKGWSYQSIFNKASELKLHDRVVFTGYLDDCALAALYHHCYGVVYVSFYEGFGIPPLEGFYHGKSCITSNNSSLPEVVGNAGILVDPYNIYSIAEGFKQFTLQHPILEQRIPSQIIKFSAAKQTSSFLDLLKTITSKPICP